MNNIIINTNEVKSRMFARLQEAFENDSQNSGHEDYVKKQNRYFNSVNHIIPSATSGLKINDALRSLDALGQDYQNPVVPYPNDIFMKTTSPELSALAKQCASSSIDQLLAIKNPNAIDGTGCGWLYTPPAKGSARPILSQGFLGDVNGPAQIAGMSHPTYKKWFFNLEQAKRQVLMDKCKAMSACTELQQSDFKTSCGWCGDRNQGIPIDSNGRLLYPNDPLGNCSSDNLYTDTSKCPPPSQDGPDLNRDSTCVPIDGKLSVACLQQTIRSAGCSANGALSMALSAATPSNYIEKLPSSDAVKVYNRHVTPQFNFDMFTQGRTTVNAVVQEVRNIAGNMSKAPNTAIGAASRDLCINRGAVKQYDICNEFSDGTSPPFLLECVQKIFLNMGGHGKGTMYPTTENLTFYNAKGSVGAVKQYVQSLIDATNSTNYITQQTALMQLLGISSEKLIKRIPYEQGVEVFWFVPRPGVPLKNGQIMPIAGFLKRTIEYNIVNLEAGPSRISQINGNAFGCMLQLTDVRTPVPFDTTFQVTVDDGFFIAVNQPVSIDKVAFTRANADEPGIFQSIGLQGPTTYTSKKLCTFSSTTPNIMRVYFEDAGGGWNALKIRPMNDTAKEILKPVHFSLTCEKNAPFLTFEVNSNTSEFQELRNPEIFSQFCNFRYLTPFNRTDNRRDTPGGKGFVRLNSSSCMSLHNIAFQSWKTMTFAIRFTSMPVKATIFSMASGQPGRGPYCCMVATPSGGNRIVMSFEYRGLDMVIKKLPMNGWWFEINKWYFFTIKNTGEGLQFYAQWIEHSKNGNIGSNIMVNLNGNTNRMFYGTNATWDPAPGQAYEACDIAFGTALYSGWSSMYVDTNCNYDIAWVHFFEQEATNEDLKQDATSSWEYTQFPKALNTY